MTAVLGALLGLGFAAGIALVVAGLRGRPEDSMRAHAPRWWRPQDVALRGGGAAFAGIVVLAATGWPVAALAAALAVVALPRLLGVGGSRSSLAMVEALATWVEMLYDSLAAGGHGLQTVIRVTAPAAPLLIRADVQGLADDCRSMPFAEALDVFADRVAHPVCDQVVRGLRIHGSERLGETLAGIATTARNEAELHRRIDVAHSAQRLTAQVIVAIIVGMTTTLTFTSFLAPYGTAAGELEFAGVLTVIGAGVWWLAHAARGETPRRLLTSRAVTPR